MRKPVYARDVYNSPEFKALCDRFGLHVPEYATEMRLALPAHGLLKVTCEYIVECPEQPDDYVELIPKEEQNA